MEDNLIKMCLFVATTLTGLLCGASLDQSIKQLPARHGIGIREFSKYVKAADLKNGVLFYAILGIGAAAFSILTGVLILKRMPNTPISLPLYISALTAIGQMICTSQAAPKYFSLKKNDEEEVLRRILNKFERIQIIRTLFVVINFIALLWALYLQVG